MFHTSEQYQLIATFIYIHISIDIHIDDSNISFHYFQIKCLITIKKDKEEVEEEAAENLQLRIHRISNKHVS